MTTRTVAGVVALVLLRLGLDASRFVADPRRYWNWEEAYNATVGWYIAHAGLADQVLNLQYKAFCGGCSALAVASVPLFSAFGDRLVVWKCIALAWTAATLFATFLAVDRFAGRSAAWATLLLLAVPTVGATDTSLMLWANHAESSLLVAIMLLLSTRGGFAFGVSVGLALWFARTSLYGAIVLVPLRLWWGRPLTTTLPASRRDRFGVLAGLALGLVPALIPAGRGDYGYYTLSPWANFFPQGLAEGGRRALNLFEPVRMGARAFPMRMGMEVPGAMVVGAAALAALLSRTRVFVAMALVFASLYAMSGFTLPRMGAAGPIINLRYHAPWFHLLVLVTGAGAGAAVATGGWRRVAGATVLIAALAAHGTGWWYSFTRFSVTPGLGDIRATHHDRFTWVATWRLTDSRLAEAHSDDPVTEAALRRMEGYRVAATVKDGLRSWDAAWTEVQGSNARIEGFAQALTDPTTAWARTEALNAGLRGREGESGRAMARGIAWNLGFGVPVGDPRQHRSSPADHARALVKDYHARARAGLAEDEACRLCAAVGAAAMHGCRVGSVVETAACLATALPDDETAYGAGVYCVIPGASRSWCTELGEKVGAAFLAGTQDPIAGLDHAFLLVVPEENVLQ